MSNTTMSYAALIAFVSVLFSFQPAKAADDLIFEDGFEGPVAIASFTIDNENIVTIAVVGGSATLRWDTNDATTCSASTTPVDSLDDWNGTTVVEIAGEATVNFPEGGVFELQLDCLDIHNNSDSKVVTAQVGSAKMTSFTVTPGTAVRDTNVTLTLDWSSENTSVLGCMGSSNWPDSSTLAASGTQVIDVENIQSDTELTLTCFSEFDEDSSTVVMDVTDPLEDCKVTLTQDTIEDWGVLFGTRWPGPESEQKYREIPRFGYFAVKFETGDVVDNGFLTNIESAGTSGYRYGSVSSCAGNFNVADACQHEWSADTGGIFWDTSPKAPSTKCKLEPNSTYYWNMTFTDGIDPQSSRCDGLFCYTIFQVSNR
jgi:hypothetical protein